jgi:hypothetical protein
MEGDKTSRKEREEIIRVELRLPESVVNKIQEYQIRNKIEGNLQQTIVTALMREITKSILIDEDIETVRKLSFIKTVFDIVEAIHEVGATERQIAAFQEACKFLRYHLYPQLKRSEYDVF